jgi:hypothetical protein
MRKQRFFETVNRWGLITQPGLSSVRDSEEHLSLAFGSIVCVHDRSSSNGQ